MGLVFGRDGFRIMPAVFAERYGPRAPKSSAVSISSPASKAGISVWQWSVWRFLLPFHAFRGCCSTRLGVEAGTAADGRDTNAEPENVPGS